MATTEWSLTLNGHVVGLNQERSMSRGERGRFVAEWRQYAWALALQLRIPPCPAIEVETWVWYPTRRGWLDLGNSYPTVKAAVDGLVDAHVIPDDCEPYVAGLTFRPNRLWASPHPALALVVRRVEAATVSPGLGSTPGRRPRPRPPRPG